MLYAIIGGAALFCCILMIVIVCCVVRRNRNDDETIPTQLHPMHDNLSLPTSNPYQSIPQDG